MKLFQVKIKYTFVNSKTTYFSINYVLAENINHIEEIIKNWITEEDSEAIIKNFEAHELPMIEQVLPSW
jgi:hypothetical protein